MAVKAAQGGTDVGAGTRFAIGANVAISIVVAAALLVAINWIASLKYWRRDLASVGNYGLSDRTRSILDKADQKISLSMVYEPNPKDEKQNEYIARLQDYLDEVATYSKNIEVTHIATDRQREQLVATISSSMGGEATAHKEALEAFERVCKNVEADLAQRIDEGESVQRSPDAWLGGFPLYSQILLKLRDMRTQVKDVQSEIAELTPQGGIPKYGEATTKAKAAVDSLKEGFEQIGQFMGRLTSLANETTRPDSDYIKGLREVAAAARAIPVKLSAAVGSGDEPMPANPSAALKKFSDACVEVAGTIDGLVTRVDRFADAFPIVKQHADWTMQVKNGPFTMQYEVAAVLQDIGRGLERMRLNLLGAIDKGNAEELQSAVTFARRNTAQIESNIGVVDQILTSLAENLSQTDPGSQAILDAARDGGLFTSTLASLEEVGGKLEGLPELKLGDVADQLRKPNSMVVESGGKIRVVDFDEVWPVRESVTGARMSAANEDTVRTFNGDSAISSAILAITADKKFANVVFVGFEPPAPEQRNPFMGPPPRSSIPLSATSELRGRLEKSNFAVYQWNLAQDEAPPEVTEGINTIHVFLPPAPPAPPSPFGQQAPAKIFGDAEREKVQSALAKSGRGIFLAGWEVSGSPFGPPTSPPYGYNPLLSSEWGLRVDNATRIVAVNPDTRTEKGFTLDATKFQYLPVTDYTDQPVGKPMRGTRSLVAAASPVLTVEDSDAAKSETITPILRIPERDEYIGASVGEIIEIVDALNAQRGNAVIELGTTPKQKAYDLIVAAEKKTAAATTQPDEAASQPGESQRIIVMGTGQSYIDGYLTQPVLVGLTKIRFDPPPTENLDLFVNAVYWLNDTPEYIGRGPVPVPRITAIANDSRSTVRVLLWAVWPAIVLAPGIVLWFIRRN